VVPDGEGIDRGEKVSRNLKTQKGKGEVYNCDKEEKNQVRGFEPSIQMSKKTFGIEIA